MNARETLAALAGDWQGPSSLWLMPGAPVRESTMKATVTPLAHGRFSTIHIDWQDEGRPQDGLMLIGPQQETVHAVWVDSWHTGEMMMRFEGSVDDDGRIVVLGSYPAESGPDWGWRIEISPPSDDGFALQMYNITPDGLEALAVQTDFKHA